MMAAERQISKEDWTMGKMNMTFEEFMEKMYGGEKPEKLSQEDLDRLKGEMQQVSPLLGRGDVIRTHGLYVPKKYSNTLFY